MRLSKIEVFNYKLSVNATNIMTYFAALSFNSYEDFEACNKVMNIRPGDTGTSSDGLFTVMIKTELRFPPGNLVIKTNKDKDIIVRVISGREQIVGTWSITE